MIWQSHGPRFVFAVHATCKWPRFFADIPSPPGREDLHYCWCFHFAWFSVSSFQEVRASVPPCP